MSERPALDGDPPKLDLMAQRWSKKIELDKGALGQFKKQWHRYASFDTSLSRRFVLTERLKLTLEAQAFNLLNRANLNLPLAFADQPDFGTITSAKAPRQLQFGSLFLLSRKTKLSSPVHMSVGELKLEGETQCVVREVCLLRKSLACGDGHRSRRLEVRCCDYSYRSRRWRTTPAKPSRPVPSSRNAPGSGVTLTFATLTLKSTDPNCN